MAHRLFPGCSLHVWFSMPFPSVSLVIGTLGRTAEVSRCVDSILSQGYPNLQVVIVDQSNDDRLVPVVERLRGACRVAHVRSNQVSSSRARNIGAHHSDGDIISFPDDDCWYTPGVLNWVIDLFIADPRLDGVTGRTILEDGRPGIGRFQRKPVLVDITNAWTTSIEFTIFLRRRVIEQVGLFDERFGCGGTTPFQAGEGTDLVLRAALFGCRIWFSPEVVIGHPPPPFGSNLASKAYGYGVGMGHLMRLYPFPRGQVAAFMLRPLAGMVLAFVFGPAGKARYHLNIARGRWFGYFRGRAIDAAPVRPHALPERTPA